jgi:signal transduction histidine kinase
MERPSSLHVLLSAPGQDGLSTTGGSVVHDTTVEQALRDGATWVRVDRDEAPAFGLPKRTAVAGLATFSGPRGRWGLVVATTALRERDREVRAQWRSVAGVVLASGLVLLFGGLAMRKQRQELELARELEISELEREREEQLVQIDKLATMAALATGIAHEVSTPLGVIVGRAEQLLPKVTHDERAAKGVASIIEQGTRISEVIRGFLNLVRGDSPPLGRAEPEAVARAAQELVLHRFEKAGVALHVVADGNLPAVACDPRLLEQVLINLLLNACDACERGGLVELAVRADDDRVRFVVVDDGVGIEPAAAAIATEPFFTTKPVGQGTGLGLAIANEIVKHYGGHFTIEPRQASGVNQPSERGPARGTRASVELPVAKEPA